MPSSALPGSPSHPSNPAYPSNPIRRTQPAQPLQIRLLTMLLAVPLLLFLLPASPAGAAIAERWGFAYVDTPNPGVGCVLDPTRQATSSGGCVEIDFAAGGQYVLKFNGIGGPGGVVHVMAVDDAGHWCQATRWGGVLGGDLFVGVDCYRPGGALSPSRFSVTYTASTGNAVPPGHAYVHWDPQQGILAQYNSAGGANTVALSGIGAWTVRIQGLGTVPLAGNVQATAVNADQGARCKVARWGSSVADQVIRVHCTDSFGNPLDTGWTLSYHHRRAVFGAVAPPRNLAYFLDVSTPPADTVFNSQGGLNTVMNAAVGMRYFEFPRVGLAPSHVMVTAYGPGTEYCGMMHPWMVIGNDAILRNVMCFDAFGNPTTVTNSLVTYTSAH